MYSVHMQQHTLWYVCCMNSLSTRTSLVYLIKSVLQDLSNGPELNLTTVRDISCHKLRSFSLLDLF